MTENPVSAEEDFGLKQSRELATAMDHWLELFDASLSEQGLALPQRPLQALMMSIREEAIEVKAGEERLSNQGSIGEHAETIWFRVLYDAVEFWYSDKYGAAAMTAKGTAPLIGAVTVRGAPFLISGPANRMKVEEEGEQAWMYFEEGLGEGEEATSWIINGPDLSKLDDSARDEVVAEVANVAETLRYVEFRRVTFHSDGDHEIQKLIQSTLTYLTQAAERLVSQRTPELGPAWFDLQMANETALKAVIRKETGKQPKIHFLDELLKRASKHGVIFDSKPLSAWPRFDDISEWRYGQGHPRGVVDFYAAYHMTLALVRACMKQINPRMKSGFGILVKYKPWSAKDAAGNYRG
tara:strand:- start:209 stop:1267 length:1059 start_codon:yes stop_codon:yes gene_type:complete